MAKEFEYKNDIEQGKIVQSWHVSQSVDAFSATNQQAYDISISGSFKATSSIYIEPSVLLEQEQNYILSYDNTTGQVFKAPNNGGGGAGTSGTSGTSGINGTSGTSGINGTSGTSGINGTSGTSGESGTSGTSGVIPNIPNQAVRYVTSTLNSGEIEVLSTGNLYSGLTWQRIGTTVTVTSIAHGLNAGDYVVIRGGADNYLYTLIANVTTDSFDYASATSGNINGTDGAYIPAVKSTNVGTSSSTIESPNAGNVQVNSIRVYTGGVIGGSEYSLTMPQSIDNGAGANSTKASSNIPVCQAYRMDTGQMEPSVYIIANTSNNFNIFPVGGLNSLRIYSIKFIF